MSETPSQMRPFRVFYKISEDDLTLIQVTVRALDPEAARKYVERTQIRCHEVMKVEEGR